MHLQFLPNPGEAKMRTFTKFMLAATFTACCVGDLRIHALGGERFQVYIGAERYSPQQEDTYCSTLLPFNEAEAYATKFSANASQNEVHHMILQACYGQPPPWNQISRYIIDAEHGIYGGCGAGSYGSLSQACVDAQIMFAWARNAPPVQLPSDISYPLGQRAGNTHFLLQVHYVKPTVGDTSGVLIDFQRTPTAQAAGVLLLGSSGGSGIPAHSESINMYMSCQFKGDFAIHPFAFRTHAHDLGRVIAGFIDHEKRGQPKIFARGDPRLPQFFYPIRDKSLTVNPGDALAAVCNFNASSRAHSTGVGATHNDEMCNLYLMYSFDMSALSLNNDGGEDDTTTSFRKRRSIQRECFDDQLNYRQYLPDPEGLKLSKTEQQALLDDAYGKNSGITVDSVMGGSMMGGGIHHHHQHPPEMNMPSMIMQHKQEPDVMQTDMQHATGAVTKKAGVVTDHHQDLPFAPDAVAPSTQNAVQPPQPANANDAVRPLLHAPPLSATNYTLVPNWFDYTQISPSGAIGQVAGMSFNSKTNRLFVFHRSSHTWGAHTFDPFNNLYMDSKKGPISDAVILEIDADTGRVVEQWGQNLFYMPHSVTVDHEENVWLTDVALHQVLKFDRNNRQTPSLTLGQKLQPGSDEKHFCKPTDVAVLPTTGEIFVSDGYCNARVVKFSPTGQYLEQIGVGIPTGGASNFFQQFIDKIPEPADFSIPHSLAIDRNGDHIYVADRENGRIQIFQTAAKMPFVKSILLEPFLGTAVYAVDFRHDTLVAVNGKLQLSGFVPRPSSAQRPPIVGAVIDAAGGAGGLPLALFGKNTLKNPHCVAFGADLQDIFVGEIGPNKLSRFSTRTGLNYNTAPQPVHATSDAAQKSSKTNADEMQHVDAGDMSHNHADADHDDMSMENMPMAMAHDNDNKKIDAAKSGGVKHDDAVVLAGQQQPPSDGVDAKSESLGSGMATMVALMFLLVPLALVCMGLMYWKTRREQALADAALGGTRLISNSRMLGDDDDEGGEGKLSAAHGGLSGISVRSSRAARRMNERANGTSGLQQMLGKQKGFAAVPTNDESNDFRASDFDDEDDDDDVDATEELFNRKKFGSKNQQNGNAKTRT